MFDLTPQEKKILIALSAFAVLGLAVLAYRTYCARPKLQPVHPGEASAEARLAESRGAVNINSADISRIETLPGIGPRLAKDIIDYRAEHGPFLLKEDLLKVKGIGKNKFGGIKDLIVLE